MGRPEGLAPSAAPITATGAGPSSHSLFVILGDPRCLCGARLSGEFWIPVGDRRGRMLAVCQTHAMAPLERVQEAARRAL